MRRTAFYVAAWFAAGVGAVALASAGVSMVGNQVTGSRPSPLSAAEVRSELAAEATTTTTAAAAGSPSTTLGGSDGGGPTATTAPRGGGPTATTTPPPPTTAPSPTTTTSTAPTASSETRTYNVVGGTATLRFSPDGVTVLVATPAAGFSVDVEPTHDTGVRVEFESDSHRSRVEGWWDGGPRDAVDEQD